MNWSDCRLHGDAHADCVCPTWTIRFRLLKEHEAIEGFIEAVRDLADDLWDNGMGEEEARAAAFYRWASLFDYKGRAV